MQPYLHVPGRLVGVALLVLAIAWILFFRARTDEKLRQVWPFGGLLGLGGLALLSGLMPTITWPAYGLAMAAGCVQVAVLGIWWAHERKLLGMEHMLEVLILSGVCGLIGARAVFLVEAWDTHFADKPPALAVPGALQPLAAGDELRLATHGGAPFSIRFQGDETSLSAIAARLETQGAAHDLVVKRKTTQHRGDQGIEVHERGLLLKTGRRGPSAQLKVVGGAAAGKLGLTPGSYTVGVAIPLSRIFDLRMGGLTYFGSVIGILLSSFIYLRLRGVSYLAMLDVIAPTLPLGLFFGRLGCLARGCCWGREAGEGARFALEFPTWSPAWAQMAGERLSCAADPQLATETLTPAMQAALGPLAEHTPPLHATQLYEGLPLLGVFVLVIAYRRWLQRRVGQTFVFLVLLQAPLRFVVEHFRRDHEVFFQGLGYPLTESQCVAALMFAAAVPAMAWLVRRGRPVDALAPADPPAGETPAEEPPAAGGAA